ncbi:MAG: PilZ domain-containing protein [Myxococcales bacterium]|nr:PilZ domain-containing protein [Myxococcales bacterium]
MAARQGSAKDRPREREPRAQLSLVTRYRSPVDEEFREDRTHDLSSNGMFIATEDPAPRATLLKVECQTAGEGEPLRAVARVAWRREESSDGRPSGMGLKFVRVDAQSSETLERVLEEAGPIEAEAPANTGASEETAVPAEAKAVREEAPDRGTAPVDADAAPAAEARGSNAWLWVAVLAAVPVVLWIMREPQPADGEAAAAPEPVAAPTPTPEPAVPVAAVPTEPAPTAPAVVEPTAPTAEPALDPATEQEPAEAAEPNAAPAPPAAPEPAAPEAAAAEPTPDPPAAAEPTPAPAPAPALAVATASEYRLRVVTTPTGAQVTFREVLHRAPFSVKLSAAELEQPIDVYAELDGHRPTRAKVTLDSFELVKGIQRRTLYLKLRPREEATPKAADAPETPASD